MLNSGERIAGAQLVVSGIGSPLIKTDVSALSNPYGRVYKIYLIHGKQWFHGDSICFSTVISHILQVLQSCQDAWVQERRAKSKRYYGSLTRVVTMVSPALPRSKLNQNVPCAIFQPQEGITYSHVISLITRRYTVLRSFVSCVASILPLRKPWRRIAKHISTDAKSLCGTILFDSAILLPTREGAQLVTATRACQPLADYTGT